MSAPAAHQPKSRNTSGMEVEPILLAERDPSSADSLVSRNDPDDLNNEQTWPDDEEMIGIDDTVAGVDSLPDAQKGTTPKSIKRIPKGMSEYQAAWIIDSGSDDDESDGGEDQGDQKGNDNTLLEADGLEDLQMTEEQDELDRDKSSLFLELNDEEEAKQCVPLRRFDHLSSPFADSRHGRSVNVRTRTTWPSQMKSTPQKMCLPAHAFNAIGD